MTSSPQVTNNAMPKHNHPATQRDAWIEIDLYGLEANIQTIRTWLNEQSSQAGVKPPQLMAVIKADAYGHGAVPVGEVLSACGVTWLAVASADEGSQLRRAGNKLPILILGPTPSWAVTRAIEHKLDLTISSLNQLRELTNQLAKHKGALAIHLKVDTGMHRLGMNLSDTKTAIELLKSNKRFKLVSVFSHLAMATDHQHSIKQKESFDNFISLFKAANYQPDFYHLACSEAVREFPFTYYDMVRIGLYIYGMEPNDISGELIPIMSVRGRINQINSIDKGESVSYGFTWQAQKATRIANIPIGYADGVDRRLSNKIQGLLLGKLINQVGTISMDQMLFDVTDIPQAKEGDVITLIGADDFGDNSSDQKKQMDGEKQCLYLADWANKLGTMVRELSCRLHMRLPRIYTRRALPEQKQQDLFSAAIESGK